MAIILGINTHHAGASAALLIDGLPVAAVAEERLNRIKYYGGFPQAAIQKCLEMGGVRLDEVDYVALGRDPNANRTPKMRYALRHVSHLPNLLRLRAQRSDLDDLKVVFSRVLGVDQAKLRFQTIPVEHHLAHIASAYFSAPLDRAAGFSMDGSGDFVTCLLARCEGDAITPLQRIFVPHSLGWLYTAICQFIGFPKYGDEGKVMGLAPYGEPVYGELLDQMVQLTPQGFRLHPQYFTAFSAMSAEIVNAQGEPQLSRLYSDALIHRLGPPRGPDQPISPRDQNLARSLQQRFEEVYLHLLRTLHRFCPLDEVVMAGGAALNSVANGKIFTHTPFRRTFIHPAAGDEGLSLGAALYVSRAVLHEKAHYQLRDAYLGPDYRADQIESSLRQAGVKHLRLAPETLMVQTVDHLVQGQIVGWFQGRMEWGPRALGNRSILADPRHAGMKDTLNARIKRRESFRPFAPAVLAERQSDIFEGDHPSPFMLHVYPIKPAWRERLGAVNHIDNTGRLQSVTRDENPRYYDLIERFGHKTGVPVILNTSFNENEPIVCTPDEAIQCFQRTRMDVLVIGDYLCRKEALPADSKPADEAF